MKLKIDKPIIFFDCETTGLNISTSRIIQLAMLKISPNGETDTKEFLINPSIHIPQETTAIHGITDKMVESQPTFAQVAEQISNFLTLHTAYLAGYNIMNFDLPLLTEEFRRIYGANISLGWEYHSGYELDDNWIFNEFYHSVLDVYRLFRSLGYSPRSLKAIYERYYHCSPHHMHNAMGDIISTIDILDFLLNEHPELPVTLPELSIYFKDKHWIDSQGRLILVENKPSFNFGKYKGFLTSDIRRENLKSYLKWMKRHHFEPIILNTIQNTIEDQIAREDEWDTLFEASRDFMCEYHEPQEVRDSQREIYRRQLLPINADTIRKMREIIHINRR